MSESLPALPDEVLRHILQHVPLQQRLSSCSLVSRRWQSVAAEATQQVVLEELDEPSRAQNALDWLSLYGQHVTRLHIVLDMDGFPQPLRQSLACPNLLDLGVQWGSVQLGPTPADGLPGVLEGCTKLTRLVVFYTKVIDAGPGDVVDSLSKLVRLQHLQLSAQAAIRLSGATLPTLRHLIHLSMRNPSAENLSQLGALTHLQELGWHVDADAPPDVTGLVLPTSLTQMHLNSHTVDVAVKLLPLVPAGVQVLRLDVCEGRAGVESLLSCIARRQCLTQFVLCTWRSTDIVWPPPGPAYSALTASSSLVSLELDAVFPAGVWPFVFPATCTLPHLTSLQFDREWAEVDALWAWGADDLSRFVSCAPNLVTIGDMALQAGLHVSVLHKLTSLTHLSVHWGESQSGTAEGLAAVTQLKSLAATVVALPPRPAAGLVPVPAGTLLPLTRLTALTALHAVWSSARTSFEAFHCERQAGSSDPPVWLQLLERCCAEDPAAQPAVVRTLAQQLSDQQQQIAGLQQQLSAQQQATAEQVASLQAQMQQLLLRLPQ